MKKRKLIASAILTTLLSSSLIAGATYSLFTSESTHNITVSSATVSVTSEIDVSSLVTKSFDVVQATGKFENGGTATIAENGRDISLEKMTPGDKVEFKINITNNSTVKVKYKITYKLLSDKATTETFFNTLNKTPNESTAYTVIDAKAAIDPINVVIELPESAGDTLQEKTCTIGIVVEAIQANAVTEEDIANAKTAAIFELQQYYNDTFNVTNETQAQADTILTNGTNEIKSLNNLGAIEVAKTNCLDAMKDKFAEYKEEKVISAIADASMKVEQIQGNEDVKNELTLYIETFRSESNNFDSMSLVDDNIAAFNKHIEDNMPANLAPVKARVKDELEEYYTNKLNGDISGDSGVYNLYLTIDDAQSEGEISAIASDVRKQIDANFKQLVDDAKKGFPNIDKHRLDELFNGVSSYEELQRQIEYCKSLDIPQRPGM